MPHALQNISAASVSPKLALHRRDLSLLGSNSNVSNISRIFSFALKIFSRARASSPCGFGRARPRPRHPRRRRDGPTVIDVSDGCKLRLYARSTPRALRATTPPIRQSNSFGAIARVEIVHAASRARAPDRLRASHSFAVGRADAFHRSLASRDAPSSPQRARGCVVYISVHRFPRARASSTASRRRHCPRTDARARKRERTTEGRAIRRETAARDARARARGDRARRWREIRARVSASRAMESKRARARERDRGGRSHRRERVCVGVVEGRGEDAASSTRELGFGRRRRGVRAEGGDDDGDDGRGDLEVDARASNPRRCRRRRRRRRNRWCARRRRRIRRRNRRPRKRRR